LTPNPDLIREQLETLEGRRQVAIRRGDEKLAAKILEEMSELAPGSSHVLEAQGDVELVRGQRQKARQLYKEAVEADPKNISAERKFAETVFAMDAADVAKLLGNEGLLGRSASGQSAFMLSLFLPGLGQLSSGQLAKGLSLLLGYLTGIGIVVFMPKGISSLLRVFGRAGPEAGELHFATIFGVLLTIVCYFASLLDAKAQVAQAPKIKVDHPVPPVDKEF